jgi:hypothetical protein
MNWFSLNCSTVFYTVKIFAGWALMAHTYNPSYMGSRD